jgi:hypothetical protein
VLPAQYFRLPLQACHTPPHPRIFTVVLLLHLHSHLPRLHIPPQVQICTRQLVPRITRPPVLITPRPPREWMVERVLALQARRAILPRVQGLVRRLQDTLQLVRRCIVQARDGVLPVLDHLILLSKFPRNI